MTGHGTPLGGEEYCASCPRAPIIPGKTTPIAVGDGRPAPAAGLSRRHLRCWLSRPGRGRNIHQQKSAENLVSCCFMTVCVRAVAGIAETRKCTALPVNRWSFPPRGRCSLCVSIPNDEKISKVSPGWKKTSRRFRGLVLTQWLRYAWRPTAAEGQRMPRAQAIFNRRMNF